jgi:hypothetical protein
MDRYWKHPQNSEVESFDDYIYLRPFHEKRTSFYETIFHPSAQTHIKHKPYNNGTRYNAKRWFKQAKTEYESFAY